jgi:hypothetical protein
MALGKKRSHLINNQQFTKLIKLLFDEKGAVWDGGWAGKGGGSRRLLVG